MLIKLINNAILNDSAYDQMLKKDVMRKGTIRITPILADEPTKFRSVQHKKSEPVKLSKLIKKVIFANPKTIVLWKDGSKTIVTANKEKFDKEKGILMAFYKHYFGREYMNDLLDVIDNAEEVKKGVK